MATNDELNQLSNMLVDVSQGEVNETVKAEDLGGEKIDWDSKFFEPEIGKTYMLKFLPNIDSINNNGALQNIVHRSYYNRLPDPTRKGKTFTYTAPQGWDKTRNLLMELFLDLNDAKKAGDMVAKTKIEKYLSRKQQACCKVQIIKCADTAMIGKIMMFRFHTFGQNATIANLINQKLNPSKEDLENGFEKENIFNIFEGRVLAVTVEEAKAEGETFRDFSKSKWHEKKTGATVIMPDDFEGPKTHKFSLADLDENGKVKPEVIPYLQELSRQIADPDISTFKWFEYKDPDDPRLSEEDREYLKRTIEKVLKVRDDIRNLSLGELANYGTPEPADPNAKKEDKASNLLSDSVPDEDIPEELGDIAKEGVASSAKPTAAQENAKVEEALKSDDLDDF